MIEIELKKKQDWKVDSTLTCYGGHIVVERGADLKTEAGLLLAGSTKTEKYSLVHYVGPECKYGVQPGDMVTFFEGVNQEIQGPNGGKLYVVAENQIKLIVPGDGKWPRVVVRPGPEPVAYEEWLESRPKRREEALLGRIVRALMRLADG